jgi:MFS family permease
MDSTLEQIYNLITIEDDESDACQSIPEENCEAVPHNFFLNAANGMATKLADQLASPGLVLPWFLDALNVPVSLIGLLTPIRRAGALLPQLVVSGQIRQLPIRKWFWIAGGVGFGLCLLLMIPAALWLPALLAGFVILTLLAIGSLARSFSSVAFKDVLAKTIPQGKRGTLLAVRATLGGILALIAGFLIRNQVDQPGTENISTYLWMIGLAGFLWICGALLVVLIQEPTGITEESRNFLQELKSGYQIFRTTPGFQKFVINRGILLSIELSLPFYTLYARRSTGGDVGALGSFVIAASLSSVLSSPLWGRFADRTSRFTMVSSAGLAGLAGLFILVLNTFDQIPKTTLTLAIPLVIIGFAIAGVRLGRKTYLVDGAPSNERPLYVAVSNTIMGILTLIGGGLGLIADWFGIQILIGILMVLAFVGMITSWRLPETDDFAIKT